MVWLSLLLLFSISPFSSPDKCCLGLYSSEEEAGRFQGVWAFLGGPYCPSLMDWWARGQSPLCRSHIWVLWAAFSSSSPLALSWELHVRLCEVWLLSTWLMRNLSASGAGRVRFKFLWCRWGQDIWIEGTWLTPPFFAVTMETALLMPCACSELNVCWRRSGKENLLKF